MRRSQHKILIVEEEMIVAEDVRCVLEDEGYSVIGTVGRANLALETAKKQFPNALILGGYNLRGTNGQELIGNIQDVCGPIPVVLTTDSTDAYLHYRGYECVLLRKPFSQEELLRALSNVLKL